jgi:proteasome lid subunit RPN8/RPN11
MSLIQITQSQALTIRHHAERSYPEECCGVLLGIARRWGDETTHSVTEVLPGSNVWSQSSFANDFAHKAEPVGVERRYAIDPALLIKSQQYARDRGWDIIGIYHSHPNHEAIPSEWDRVWAWPQYSYLIVSVRDGAAQDLQSWALDMHHMFLPEKLMISEATDSQSEPRFEDAP